MKQRYIRVDYATVTELDQMTASRSLAGTEKWLTVTLRPGDFILAAQYKDVSRTGEVRLVGQIQVLQGRLEVEWKPARFNVHPTDAGRTQWITRPSFKFDTAVAARYNLEAECRQLFPISPTSSPQVAQSHHRASDASSRPASDPGYIYVIKSEYGYKIGKSKNLQDRTRLFSVKLPFPISVEISAWSPTYSIKERDLHRRFAHKRLEGEWFALNGADLNQIRATLLHDEGRRQ